MTGVMRKNHGPINSAPFSGAKGIHNNSGNLVVMAGLVEHTLPVIAADDAKLNQYLIGAVAGAAHEQKNCPVSPHSFIR